MQLYEKQILTQIIYLMDLHRIPLNSTISMSLQVTRMIKHLVLQFPIKLNYLIKEKCTIKYLNITVVERVLGKVLGISFPPSILCMTQPSV